MQHTCVNKWNRDECCVFLPLTPLGHAPMCWGRKANLRYETANVYVKNMQTSPLKHSRPQSFIWIGTWSETSYGVWGVSQNHRSACGSCSNRHGSQTEKTPLPVTSSSQHLTCRLSNDLRWTHDTTFNGHSLLRRKIRATWDWARTGLKLDRINSLLLGYYHLVYGCTLSTLGPVWATIGSLSEQCDS